MARWPGRTGDMYKGLVVSNPVPVNQVVMAVKRCIKIMKEQSIFEHDWVNASMVKKSKLHKHSDWIFFEDNLVNYMYAVKATEKAITNKKTMLSGNHTFQTEDTKLSHLWKRVIGPQ
jgi:hypothetical protein